MKTTVIALAIVMLAACNQQQRESATNNNAAPSPAKQVQAASLSPEDLGTLGAQIKKDPSRAHELLAARGLDDQSFEKAIRKVSQDPVASRRYAAAFKAAS
jgi:hypothetical protein